MLPAETLTPRARREALRLFFEAVTQELNASVGSEQHHQAREWVAAVAWALGLYPNAPEFEVYVLLEARGIALRPLPAEQEDTIEGEEFETW